MFPLEEFETTLKKVVGVLRSLKIAFHLTGGVTSITYGEPRMTQDVDIVIDNAAAAINTDQLIQKLLGADFLLDETAVRKAIADRRLFQLLDKVETLKIDIYPRELIEGELTRSEVREVFPGLHLPVASLADAAVSKLIWVSKGSHKNRRDVRRIVSRATVTQQTRITDLASLVGLSQLLDEVLNEPDEIE